jgi:type II secretory pathway component PulC
MNQINQVKNNTILLGFLTVIFLIIGVFNLNYIVTTLLSKKTAIDEVEKGFKLKAFEQVDKALENKVQPIFFTFEGTFDPPFRKLPVEKVKSRSMTPANKPVLKKLFLKGTLNKENALAIIEDEDGKTYICKEGDKVHNRLIFKISEDQVVIKDNGSKTVLLKKED